ncbi:MAG: RNA polymerase sigma factor [bacterium]|nr:RNA polymerase sigma factor [Candidatus Kapabacteria bacterium]
MSSTLGPDETAHNSLQEEFLRQLLPLRDRLSHYARAVARTREEADDLVGDTILAALEGFGALRSHDGFASYLFRIASRLYKRRRWRRRLFGELDADRSETLQSTTQSPETSTEVVLLYQALDALPVAQREAVVLFEISGLSLEEVRVIQGGSMSAVKSRVSRGRQQLARLLGAHAERAETRFTTVEISAIKAAPTNGVAANGASNPKLIYSGPQING